MPDGWTYSDWRTGYTAGSSAQLARLDLHIQEVVNRLKSANYTTEGKSHDVDPLVDYLKQLREDRASIEASAQVSSGVRTSFTRARLV